MLANTNVKFGDDVKPRKISAKIKLPSTSLYENYLNRENTFQILDNNLRISINQRELSIRKVEKEDKNLGPGEFVHVDNIKDLTGDEIRKVNQLIDSIDFDNRILFISDDRHAFLISKIKASEENTAEESKEFISQESDPEPFATVDEVPVFPGCEDASNKRACFNEKMQRHIAKNFNYPKEAQEKGIQGRVNVMFIITKKGKIEGLRMRGPDSILEKEVERIIGRLPKMKPGKHKGKKVEVPFSIPIEFKLKENQDNDVDVPFSKVENVPVFPGCEDDDNKRNCFTRMIQKHIAKNFNYPLEAQEKGIQGRVSIMFTVSKDGSIQNVRMRGPDALLEKEAARIIGLLPKMTPGKHKGKAVNVPFSIPITFRLQGKNDDLDLDKIASTNKLEALYIIDDKESTMAALKLISPSDIESIDVLKGDAAYNAYGEKGKNGVVTVVTKEAKRKVFDTEKVVSNMLDNDPLFIIDGKESTNEKMKALNPNDIESITVLKDEAAEKKYGDKGKKGVIEIITKNKD